MCKQLHFSDLTISQQRLLRLCQQINYGQIHALRVENGEPCLTGSEGTVRLELKLDSSESVRQELSTTDFILCREFIHLLNVIEEIADGRVECIDIRAGFGELGRVSNPYSILLSGDPGEGLICGLGGSGQIWNSTFYDELGQVRQELAANQASTLYTYAAGQVTMQDPAGKIWRREFDGLGRLKKVVEEAYSGGANEETVYVYDAADRLKSVTQGAQSRTFDYNWAGQLLTATNPENGVTSYQYDIEGNLIAKLDARGAGYCAGNWNGTVCDGTGVDGLGRITRKTYLTGTGVATQPVMYCFDGKKPVRLTGPDRIECNTTLLGSEKGFLTGVGNLASRTEYEHDPVGRMTRTVQTTEGSPAPANAREVEYQYWASDRIKATTLPSGRSIVECISWGLRIVWASGSRTANDCVSGVSVGASESYVTNAEYTPHGALNKWQFGNGLWEVSEYNERLQMTRKRIGPNGNTQACGVAVDDELCLEWGYDSTVTNNGNVRDAKQWAKKTAGGYLQLQSIYTYDGRNRLHTFNESVVSGGTGGGSWGQTSGYDRYGNRWANSTGVLQTDWTPTQQTNINAANNRVVTARLGSGTAAITYDAAGQMTGHPHLSGNLSYDGEGRMVSGGGASYTYDGEGRRVKKVAGGTTTWFWYGGDGGLVAEDSNEPGQEGGVRYLSIDALGSTRLVTKGDGSVEQRVDYWPFGEEIIATTLAGNRNLVSGYGGTSQVKQKFTGKERDAETGLDYFGARYMSAAQGRFTSPDIPLIDQSPVDPQSWNLYAYGRNNPLKYVDPTGNVVETIWDIANVVMDVVSLGRNVAAGDWSGAAVDAGGLLVDAAATILPGVPGGAGTAIKAARAADNLVDGAQSLKRVSSIADNAKAGKAFEQQAVSALKKEQTGVVEQLTVKTQSGTKVRIDAAGKNTSGNIALSEAKGSATAGLTKNQKKGFPEIQQGGATVVGKGRPGFPPGTQIPPTPVRVIRPDDLKNMNP